MDCPSCGVANPDGKRFCGDCGAPLPLQCLACGATSPPGKRFCGDCGTSLAADTRTPPPVTAAAAAPPQPAARGAERRQLTVMFCDLVDSTALAARLDPEDLRDVIAAYHACVAGEVRRFDGQVAKYMGDGVLAYFGYPQAHEDDAERAVRAGLAVVEAVGRLSPGGDRALKARVGVATGLVVVGDLIGEGAAQEQAVVGETPNLAARLQALAAPGSVVIAPSTRRLVAGSFAYADLGAQPLKGFAEPVPAWRVLGPSSTEGRFEARQAGGGLTKLLGREHEVALLLDRWQRAKDGEGQVVLLSGEPGIGKSRLVQVLRQRLAAEPHIRLGYQCSPYHRTSPLHPVIEQLERAAGFARDDRPERKLEKLEGLLAGSAKDLGDVVPLVAALLSIPTGGRYPLPNLSPQRQKQRTLEALVGQLEALAKQQPALTVFEDVHWIDPSTQELLDLVVERVQRLPALVLITFRPDFRPAWSDLAHVRLVVLGRLGQREGATMAGQVAHGKALPVEVLDQIVAKADGVPLFVEELTKTVLESGLLRDEGDRLALAGPLPPLAIPATLHDSLMARLDRLAPVKEVAQTAAAIGREFSHELLAAVTPLREEALRDALDRLVGAELIYRRGVPPEASYSFKHALVQDAAYASLLKSRRQQLHARIAEVLEREFADVAEAQPELLARHCTQAGLAEKGVGYWYKAGQRAIARSAMTEAVAHLTHGLTVLHGLPDTIERKRQEIGLQTALGVSSIIAKGTASREVEEAYVRARDLCNELEDRSNLFPVLWNLWRVYYGRGEMVRVNELTGQLLSLARRQHEPAFLLQAYHALWSTVLFSGELTLAKEYIEKGQALYRPQEHHSHALLYGGHDPGGCCRNMAAWALWLLGYPDQAVGWSDSALTLAEELGHPETLAHVLYWNGPFHQFRRDRDAVARRAETLHALATEQAFVSYFADADVLRGWVLAGRGREEEGVALMRKGLAARLAAATGRMYLQPYLLSLLAEVLAKSGRAAEALVLVTQALEQVEATGERWFEAELHRLEGELRLSVSGGDSSRAEVSFRKAVKVARAQSAKMWELRAATGLARLWNHQGKRAEAGDLLAPVYGWFTEGFGTPDLREARALLDELG